MNDMAPARGQPPAASLVGLLASLGQVNGPDSIAGVTAGLRAPSNKAWRSASALDHQERVEELLLGPAHRWAAPRHAAASLAWKSYSYWLALPVVVARVFSVPVPVPTPDRVLYRLASCKPFVQFAFTASAETGDITVLPGENPGEELRFTLLEQHLDPLIGRLVQATRVTPRVLRGELSYGIARIHQCASALIPRPTVSLMDLLEELGLDTGVVVDPGEGRHPVVARRTCCLALVVPGLGHRVCADCVVPPSRRRTHHEPRTKEG